MICIRDLHIEPLELTDTQAAVGLGVSRKTLSMQLNGHAGISPETLAPTCPARTCQDARSAGVAVHLSKAFGRTPEGWLQLQMQCDLAQINQQANIIQVTRFGRPETELMSAGA